MPTRDHIESAIQQYVDAVGSQDLDATLALFAEDAHQEDPVGTPPNVGRDAIRGFFEKAYSVPFSTELTGPLLVTGDHAAFHFTIRVPLGDDTMTVRVIDQVRFGDDGLIAELRAVVD
ncbi:MAG TPA: nuclear transport factor 2 family protein [Marmoricola sp.]|jgi:steroid delta-isomerase|nr:nuclear transport factor 2 family protein [Marmoricola sp.]